MPTSHELLAMGVNEFEQCQQRLARGEYDATDDMLSAAVPGPYVYPTEVEFLAMTTEEINTWIELPCLESEADSPELELAVAMAQCIRRLRVMGILPEPKGENTQSSSSSSLDNSVGGCGA